MRVARQRRGLTKRALSISSKLPLRSLTDYESGHTQPPQDVVARLGATLRFPEPFFTADDIETPPVESVSFRALKAMTALQRDAALATGAIAIELSDWLDARFDLPSVDIPALQEHGPETAAEVLRAEWRLGTRPIRNMIHLLEAHGAMVFSVVEDCREVDAFSFWRGDRAFVFLNTARSAERMRMDAAHELGHLVLHRGRVADRAHELDARRFGSAFLMPEPTVRASAAALPMINSLMELKRQWNVSLAAVAFRLHELGLVTDWHYHRLCVQMSALGYRTAEPNPCPMETSQLMGKVLERLITVEKTGFDEIAHQLHVDSAELKDLVFSITMIPVSGGRASRPDRRSAAPLRLVHERDSSPG